MTKYKLSDDKNIVLDIESNPINPIFLSQIENEETIKYLKWVQQGNTPLPYDNFNYGLHRKKEYPSIEDQLDILFHQGFESWKDAIQKVKDKYPKPTNNGLEN